ncbi:MAG: carbohydrate ABC transporter permease [Treponema sp.]|nr:carbohydrate ABC transporter permease [Treponema sp.]
MAKWQYMNSKDTLLQIFKYAVLVAACILVIVPIMTVLLGSFKEHQEFLESSVFAFPRKAQLANYYEAFFQGRVLEGLLNTCIILVISCAGTIMIGTMTAFVVQRFKSILTTTVKTAFLIANLLPGITIQITVFQVINSLGLYNTMGAPIILYVGTDIVSIYIFIQFMNQISTSLDESAIIDGASYPRVYWNIILPMLQPAIATVLVIKFIAVYNDFYTPNLYLNRKRVVSTALYSFIGPFSAKWEVIFAGVVICIIPSLIIFLALQKFIYSNLVSGSVKE